MNNLDSGITNEVMSRRSFLAGSAAVAGGVALAAAGLTVPTNFAFATTTLAPGDYTVNANLFISKNLVIIRKNAYFTDPADPNANGSEDDIPDTPCTFNNATMNVSNAGLISVTVPLVNECFMSLSLNDGGGAHVVQESITRKLAIYKEVKNNDADLYRITSVKFELSNTDGTYVLTNCESYGAYTNPPLPMAHMIPGRLTWPATLKVDFSSAQRVNG